MNDQTTRAEAFARLHVKGDPIVLYNVWDAGTASAVAKAGARAIATGSWSVAEAHGYRDGEALPMLLALANLERIGRAVDLPVSLDFESGYGTSPEEVAINVSRAVAAGAAGINLEDRIIGGEGLYAIAEQCARIKAVREAAERDGVPLVINARTDIFLRADPATHDRRMAEAALERGSAYAEAGGTCFFVPGLADEALIGLVCQGSRLPVNVLATARTPSNRRLAELGVARISYGPGPYRIAMQAVEEAARAALSPVKG